jgi:phospholipid/cholesterol/gamma-HCH transport system substrate-binding protein
MKISNETKVGVLAAVAIVLLILGFNFLKGRNLFDRTHHILAVFPKVNGLAVSNPVMVNGLQVGSVYKFEPRDKRLDAIIVTLSLNKGIDIPKNSFATINQDLLGTTSMNIEMGDDAVFLKDGDTLSTRLTTGLVDDFKSAINPAVKNINGTLTSLDSLLEVVGTYFDPSTKNNFHRIVANMTASSNSLEKLLNAQSGALAQSLNNVNAITGNFAKNNEKINGTLDNLQKTTANFSQLKLQETLQSLQSTLDQTKAIMAKANSKDGSLGLLLNDKKLYTNLENTSRSLNILLDDFRIHPKRYINVSVFGKKDKSTPLSAPIADSVTRQ